MRKHSFLKLGVMFVVAFLLLGINNLYAGNRWIDGTFSTELNMLLRDDIRDNIYLADGGNSQLVIIDSKNEEVVAEVPLSSKPVDMIMTPDSKRLIVITEDTIFEVQPNSFKKRILSIPEEVEGKVKSLAFDADGNIVVSTIISGNNWGWIYCLDKHTRKVISKFGVGPNLDEWVYSGLLRTDATGSILYVGAHNTVTSSMCKIDITDSKSPVFLAESAYQEIGSNMRDFVVSPRYNELYIASGSPHGIQVVDADVIGLITLLSTGPYPEGVAIDRNGDTIYGLPGNSYNDYLYKFDAESRNLVNTYSLLSEILNGEARRRGIAIDRLGEKAFVIHGRSFPYKMRVQVIDVAEPSS